MDRCTAPRHSDNGLSVYPNRRQYSAEFKAKIVLQVLSGKKTVSNICRTHKLNANVVSRWHKEFLEQAPSLFERGDRRVRRGSENCSARTLGRTTDRPVRDSKKSIDEFEAEHKREVVMQLSQEYPIATVCRVMNYPRSQAYYQPNPSPDESDLKSAIRTLAGRLRPIATGASQPC